MRKAFPCDGVFMFSVRTRVEVSIKPSNILTHHSAAYMRQWIRSALAQIMAYSAPSHYLNQCWVIVNWTNSNKVQCTFNQNSNFFIQENAFENVACEIAAIFSRRECHTYMCMSCVCRAMYNMFVATLSDSIPPMIMRSVIDSMSEKYSMLSCFQMNVKHINVCVFCGSRCDVHYNWMRHQLAYLYCVMFMWYV